MSTLKNIQDDILNHIYNSDMDHASQHISTDDRFDSHQRLNVYRNNKTFSLRETLSNVFPVTKILLGNDFFHQTADRFVGLMPPESPNINHYGLGFPASLKQIEALSAHPYIPDVAALEWARHQCALCAIAQSVSPEDLTALSTQNPDDIFLKLQPHVRLVTSPFPIFDIWSAIDSNGEDADLGSLDMDTATAHLVIYRSNLKVVVWQVPPIFYGFFNGIHQGRNFADLINGLADYDDSVAPQDLLAESLKLELLAKIL